MNSLLLLIFTALAVLAAQARILLDCGGKLRPGSEWRTDVASFTSDNVLTSGATANAHGFYEPKQTHCYITTGDLILRIPVRMGKYNVKLLFAETWHAATNGTRVFSVSVNGVSLDSALDVYSKVGYDTLFPLMFPAMSESGFITIKLGRIAGKNNPFISGVVVDYEKSSMTPVSALVGKPGTKPPKNCRVSTWKLNVGSTSAVSDSDWVADATTLIAETDKGHAVEKWIPSAGFGGWRAQFLSHRFTKGNSLTYRIPVRAGVYTVTTLHAEAHMTGVGQRVFGITINGRVMRKELDVFASAGRNKPLLTTFRGVKAVRGHITISFTKIVENPFVNGIVLHSASRRLRINGNGKPCPPAPSNPAPMFMKGTFKNSSGAEFATNLIASITYGPDGRLYAGSLTSMLYAFRINSKLTVTETCSKNIGRGGPNRVVYGVAFNPGSSLLELFFSTGTTMWGEQNSFPTFAEGWKNGRVESVTMDGPNGCFNNNVTDVVTGLPVSNASHGVSGIVFLPDGQMLVSVGSVTNGGVRDVRFGDLDSGPLDGAVLTCPSSGTAMTYSTPENPKTARVISGDCKIYSEGVRNAFSMELHTLRRLYAIDSAANERFGDFLTSCSGATRPGEDLLDRLIELQRGQCYGQPNLNREQCLFQDPKCKKPLLDTVESVTTGIVEYRANTFRGKLKGNLFLSSFVQGSGPGRLDRVQLNARGSVKQNGFTRNFSSISGIAVAAGPRGELVFSSVFGGRILVAKPVDHAPDETTLLSVMPRQGPSDGGIRVTLHGYHFGKSPSVFFGGVPCGDVQVVDDKTISCVPPKNNRDTQVNVRVLGANGASLNGGTDYWYY